MKIMAMRFSIYMLLVLSVYFISNCPVNLAHRNEDDPTIKTMEEFSGYPIHESHFLNSLSSLSVDAETLQKQIDELSSFSDSPAPSVTRILYSEKDVLSRRTGSEPELAPVSTGSHTDAIPYSGKYDGVVGVLGAIEAINVLKRSSFKPKRSLDVIMFTSEEPTRFGIGCLGSRLLAGSKELAQQLEKTVDGQNVSFFYAAKSAGYMNVEKLSTVFLEKGSYSAFVELHIEQGPILEEEATSIGIVTAIAAPASIKVDFEGTGGHAGAVLMPKRNDAGLAAAELALAVEKHVLESGSIDTVGTVGILELHPGAINSIPSKSHLEIDTRDIDEERRNSVIDKIYESALSISKRRGVKLSEYKIVNQDPPALSDELIIKAAESASQELELTYKKMISRAYHDALFMARVSPMGMIFIPCYKGYSHKPEEFATIDHIADGVKVLALTLAKLSLS
ncbi:ureidoglycolate hydrolase isoform X2 [Coffea arabica]|uniref:Ureidoglycolate hydrolase isoform X2 n=1 Tax=Coffea arabica TaxID=13443 RepID=A0A6P6WMG5_COFAR|nr:ureidoglycolate hydrolase isoform X2 [Coffea arabica]